MNDDVLTVGHVDFDGGECRAFLSFPLSFFLGDFLCGFIPGYRQQGRNKGCKLGDIGLVF